MYGRKRQINRFSSATTPEVLRENSAQKQEIALLNYELERAKIRPSK